MEHLGVDAAENSWHRTGWLDWEFFDGGYGSPRVPVVSELYEFAIMLWMSNQDAAATSCCGLPIDELTSTYPKLTPSCAGWKDWSDEGRRFDSRRGL